MSVVVPHLYICLMFTTVYVCGHPCVWVHMNCCLCVFRLEIELDVLLVLHPPPLIPAGAHKVALADHVDQELTV